MLPCQANARFLAEGVIPHQTRIGVDYSLGLRLPQLLMAAGLRVDAVFVDQPIFREGLELLAEMATHTEDPDVWVAAAKTCLDPS